MRGRKRGSSYFFVKLKIPRGEIFEKGLDISLLLVLKTWYIMNPMKGYFMPDASELAEALLKFGDKGVEELLRALSPEQKSELLAAALRVEAEKNPNR